MFTFFTKKTFLIDYLDGFIDIHNHLLPGIDDGAKTVEDSITLLKEFSSFGVTNFVATPHIMNNYYPNTPDSIRKSHALLQNALLQNDLKDISISASAEHMIDDNFEDILEKNEVMPLRKNYLLVEMSYLQPSINFNEAINKIASHRLFPILAHPERYVFLHKSSSLYQKHKSQGILFQLNLLSLGNYYGSEVQKAAHKLLENGLIDFAASDCHNITQLNALKELKLSNKTLQKILPVLENTIYNFY